MGYTFKELEDHARSFNCLNAGTQSDIGTQLRAECNRLLQLGLRYKLDAEQVCDKAQIEYTKLASGGTIHRGFYCPSPVIDIIIGNARRGKLLQRSSKRSRILHEYGFDRNDDLCYAKEYLNGSHVFTEFLSHSDHVTMGITMDTTGQLTAVSEEAHQEGKLQTYRYAQYCQLEQEAVCFSLRIEQYRYDDEGLYECDVLTFAPVSQIVEHDAYLFSRKEGCLDRYIVKHYDGNEGTPGFWDGHVFNIEAKRKA